MLHQVKLMLCFLLLQQHTIPNFMGLMNVVEGHVTPKPIIKNDGTYINPELGKYHARLRTLSRSCRVIREKFNATKDGIYYLVTENGVTYQAYCDMTTLGGGWTLVASVHENNLNGNCTTGDNWSSQQGNDPNRPDGDGNWANTAVFGTAESATSEDYKNPGYYDITGDNIAMWHVPNDVQLQNWTSSAILRYHTDSKLLSQHGGNLYHLFKKYPVRFGTGECKKDSGPVSHVAYDTGDENTTKNLFKPFVREDELYPDHITLRMFNGRKAAMAICLWVKPNTCPAESYCIGGGGYFPSESTHWCGDITARSWKTDDSHSTPVTKTSVLIFYR
ncbi:intelectin-like [Trichomycterus rosablanca]|uniref:intelectin-like n=1 Tax=Trichomycterus rosablanca TaxID=2290929 RepID=UPI002F34F78D